MGDRTYASITIDKNVYQEMLKEFGDEDKIYKKFGVNIITQNDIQNNYEFVGTVTLADEEANYGNIESLENFLKENEIEYDKFWAEGGEYEAGNEYARNVDGVYWVHAISLSETKIAETIKEILKEEDLKKALEPFEVTNLHQTNTVKFMKEDE